jgi:hypothetical protein
MLQQEKEQNRLTLNLEAARCGRRGRARGHGSPPTPCLSSEPLAWGEGERRMEGPVGGVRAGASQRL